MCLLSINNLGAHGIGLSLKVYTKSLKINFSLKKMNGDFYFQNPTVEILLVIPIFT